MAVGTAAVVVSDPEKPHLGLFLRAARDVKVGEVVLQETPLLRVKGPKGALPADALAAPSLSALRSAKLFVPDEASSRVVKRLRAECRRPRPRAEPPSEEEQEAALLVRSVLHFNSFGAGPAGRDQVVFPTLARANHSCAPNCLADGDLGTLRAMRPVAAGEELTVSYLDDAALLMAREARRKELQEHWEFHCACKRCEALGDDVRRFHAGCSTPGCKGELLAHSGGLQTALRCESCGDVASTETQQALLRAEESAMASLDAARSGDLEEEDEGQELMKCHRFAAQHPCHAAALALAHEFAFPDPVPAKRAVLEGLRLILKTPCQLALEAGRELAQLLEERGESCEARRRLEEAAEVAGLLDGKSREQVLQDWGRPGRPGKAGRQIDTQDEAPKKAAPVQSPDLEALAGEGERASWLQQQRKAAASSAAPVGKRKITAKEGAAREEISKEKAFLDEGRDSTMPEHFATRGNGGFNTLLLSIFALLAAASLAAWQRRRLQSA
eukprot:TRINITY_DN67538_c0_g1_i1.p1 TRINITY_DN67538_c0_g1~~TRINITY_DN67538_c0_g1_i1.p1  ORF type:complete len:501 (+),score=131.08 TRINITY_DN67538_c0_g1_i1:25-1527(+)